MAAATLHPSVAAKVERHRQAHLATERARTQWTLLYNYAHPSKSVLPEGVRIDNTFLHVDGPSDGACARPRGARLRASSCPCSGAADNTTRAERALWASCPDAPPFAMRCPEARTGPGASLDDVQQQRPGDQPRPQGTAACAAKCPSRCKDGKCGLCLEASPWPPLDNWFQQAGAGWSDAIFSLAPSQGSGTAAAGQDDAACPGHCALFWEKVANPSRQGCQDSQCGRCHSIYHWPAETWMREVCSATSPFSRECPSGCDADTCPGHCIFFWESVVYPKKQGCRKSDCTHCHNGNHWPSKQWIDRKIKRTKASKKKEKRMSSPLSAEGSSSPASSCPSGSPFGPLAKVPTALLLCAAYSARSSSSPHSLPPFQPN